MHAGGSGVRLDDVPDIKLLILVGLGRSFFVCCLAHRGSTVDFLLLQCSSGVVRHPGDLRVSVATPSCRVLILALERQDRLPTMYWLPKLHKRPYKARFIANSSSCTTTTELSELLTSCLTAVKNHVIRICEKVYERSGKTLFWSIKNSGEVLNKLKSRGFRATSLSTYDFSSLYTTLPHNLIKEKLINVIGCTFKREGSPYIACNERQPFFNSEDTKRYNFGLVKTCVKP